MHARQIMTRKVITVAPEHTVRGAAHLMLKSHVCGLPVVNQAGGVVGTVSEGDSSVLDGFRDR